MPTFTIEDYGIIGNLTSSALVNRIGAIDWCCLPFLDSPSHFAAILDPGGGGKLLLRPQGDFRSEQRYLQRSLVLETLFETPFGRAVLTDWMPLSEEPVIYRRIDVIEGKVSWTLLCDPRFDYAETPTEVEIHATPVPEVPPQWLAWSRRHLLFRGKAIGQIAQLFSSLELEYSAFSEARFTLTSGQSACFAWTWGRRAGPPPSPARIPPSETTEAWRRIAHRCITSGCLFAGPWHDAAVKTGLFLKLLVAPYSGSIAEAITTSIGASETSGSAGAPSTSDHRYAWVRNCGFTLQALASLGMKAEAVSYFGWLSGLVIRDGVELLQPMYTLDGGKILPERELRHLKGFQDVTPVRVGNETASLFHLDIYGHVLLASDLYHAEWGALPEGLWPRLKEIADFVCGAWRRPDHGPWNNREKAEHYVASKALCWSALDCARRIAARLGERPDSRWAEEMKTLHRTICEQGFDSTLNSFVRSFGDTECDTSALILPLIGFVSPEDPRMRGTVDAIMDRLSEGVLLRRSASDLPGLLDLWSSFLLVMNLALGGQVDDAGDRMAELCSFATHLGFFGEQVDARTQRTAGNFPSASAHFALINAALYIGAARGRTLPIRHLLAGSALRKETGKGAARKIA